MINDRAVEIVLTESLQNVDNPQKNSLNELLKDLIDNLPAHFKLEGIKNKERNLASGSKTKSSYMAVLGVSLHSIGVVLQALHIGQYEKIVICDIDVNEFDVTRMINDFVHTAAYRGIERLGTSDRTDIMRKLGSIIMVRNGSDVRKTLVALDGQADAEKAALRKKLNEEKKAKEIADAEAAIAATQAKSNIIAEISKSGGNPFNELNKLI